MKEVARKGIQDTKRRLNPLQVNRTHGRQGERAGRETEGEKNGMKRQLKTEAKRMKDQKRNVRQG